jgi:hypothetical protein
VHRLAEQFVSSPTRDFPGSIFEELRGQSFVYLKSARADGIILESLLKLRIKNSNFHL